MAVNTPNYVTAGTKQFGFLPIMWSGYQTNRQAISDPIYFDNSTSYPISTVGTATITPENNNGPLLADKFNSIYNPQNTDLDVPLVDRSRSHTRITATAANDGIKVPVKLNKSGDNYVVLVHKSAAASVSGKLKLRSSAGNESIIAFTTSATANQWLGGGTKNTSIFSFRDQTKSNVTFLGTPDFSSITEIEITLDAPGEIEVAELYFTKAISEAIGALNTITLNCLSSASKERAQEQADLMCNQLAEMSIGTSKSVEWTITVKKQDLNLLAAISGSVAKVSDAPSYSVFTSPNLNPNVITGGTITLSNANLNIANVSVTVGAHEQPLQYFGGDVTDIEPGQYHVDGATVTFHPTYEGKVPTIYIHERKDLPNYADRGLVTGPVGFAVITRETEAGGLIQEFGNKVQLTYSQTAMEDDGDTIEIKAKFYADSNRDFSITTQQ